MRILLALGVPACLGCAAGDPVPQARVPASATPAPDAAAATSGKAATPSPIPSSHDAQEAKGAFPRALEAAPVPLAAGEPGGMPAEPVEPRPLDGVAARAVARQLPSWHAQWAKRIPGFSLQKFVLSEQQIVPSPRVEMRPDDDETTWRSHDLEFIRRQKSLFRPSPDGTLWADIYVTTFSLGDPDDPLQADFGDTSVLAALNPQTGHARVLWTFSISCGFDDATWLSPQRLLAVGSCIDGEEQRPFVVQVDLESLLLERFDSPLGTPGRFDTEKYIHLAHPQIRFAPPEE